MSESLVQSGLSSFATGESGWFYCCHVPVVTSPLLWGCSGPCHFGAHSFPLSLPESTRVYTLVRDQIGDALATPTRTSPGCGWSQAFGKKTPPSNGSRRSTRRTRRRTGHVAVLGSFPRWTSPGSFLGHRAGGRCGALPGRRPSDNGGAVAAFVLYLANLFNAITSLSALFDLLQSSGRPWQRCNRLLEVEPGHVLTGAPGRPCRAQGTLELRTIYLPTAPATTTPRTSRTLGSLEGVDPPHRGPGERRPWLGPTGGGSRRWPSWPGA